MTAEIADRWPTGTMAAMTATRRTQYSTQKLLGPLRRGGSARGLLASGLGTAGVMLVWIAAVALGASVERGGAYEERVAGWDGGGRYLALFRRESRTENLGETLEAAFGDRRMNPDLSNAGGERERQAGEDAFLRSIDAAWSAANVLYTGAAPSGEQRLIVTESDGRLGLREGDLIETINGEAAGAAAWEKHVVRGVRYDARSGRAYGQRIKITYRRGDETLRTEGATRLETRLEGGGSYGEIRGMIGSEVEPVISFNEARPEMQIMEGIGGASAGLVHALLYVDYLGEGDLSGGLVVAATGVIDAEGRVATVGGMEVKADAAAASGADVLFVPRTNARAAEGRGVDVVAVGSLHDAVRWLCRRGGTDAICARWAETDETGVRR